ncbi:Cysteine-rich secretory protein LCCL domain-containing 1, partial [Xenotaenia resolanae]
QQVECETKLRDQCKGTTCNRYECPPGCFERPGKVVGTAYYDMQSSVCGAGLHSGVIDNDGGWLDVTRLGRKQFFTKSYKNGIQSIGKNRSANSFKVESVPVKAVRCDTTVALFCPFKKPIRHCPRLYCPRNCLDNRARVIGTKYYSDKSSICRAAIHAGVIQSVSGGYLDVMPVDKRQQYSGSYQNGITSESLLNPTGGKAFRVFAVI